MVSNIKYYSFKEFDKQKVPFIVLLLAVLVFGVVLYDIPVGLLAIGIAYVLSGFVTTLNKNFNNTKKFSEFLKVLDVNKI